MAVVHTPPCPVLALCVGTHTHTPACTQPCAPLVHGRVSTTVCAYRVWTKPRPLASAAVATAAAHAVLLLVALHTTNVHVRLRHSKPWCTTAVPKKQGRPKQGTAHVENTRSLPWPCPTHVCSLEQTHADACAISSKRQANMTSDSRNSTHAFVSKACTWLVPNISKTKTSPRHWHRKCKPCTANYTLWQFLNILPKSADRRCRLFVSAAHTVGMHIIVRWSNTCKEAARKNPSP